MKLYYHKTDGGAEYLTDTYITYTHPFTGKRGREGRMTDKTKYLVRIDGDITKDAEINVREDKKQTRNNIILRYKCAGCGERVLWSVEDLIARGEPVCNNCDEDMYCAEKEN